ncbi:unnamed protein product [Boreogadus saida]
MAKLMTGDRGGKVLVLDEFRYHRHRTNQQNIRWRSAGQYSGATSLMVRKRILTSLCMKAGEHVYPPDRVRVHNADFRQEVIGEVEREPTVPIRRFYNARRVALQQHRTLQGGRDREPPQDFPSVRSVMARARKHVMPPIPPAIEDEMEPQETIFHAQYVDGLLNRLRTGVDHPRKPASLTWDQRQGHGYKTLSWTSDVTRKKKMHNTICLDTSLLARAAGKSSAPTHCFTHQPLSTQGTEEIKVSQLGFQPVVGCHNSLFLVSDVGGI